MVHKRLSIYCMPERCEEIDVRVPDILYLLWPGLLDLCDKSSSNSQAVQHVTVFMSNSFKMGLIWPYVITHFVINKKI